jgi:hypothetical protein
MVTKVACKNAECRNYKIVKTVASAMMGNISWKNCLKCGEPMQMVEQINVSTKSPKKKIGRKRISPGIGTRRTKARTKKLVKRTYKRS